MSITMNEDGTVTVDGIPTVTSVTKYPRTDSAQPDYEVINMKTSDGADRDFEHGHTEYQPQWTEQEELYILGSIACLFRLREIDAANAVIPTEWWIDNGDGPFTTREDALKARSILERYTASQTFGIEEKAKVA